MSNLAYIGNELELFSLAENWKNYWSDQVSSYLTGRVMEVGAGLGGTTRLLLPKTRHLTEWIALEPDPNLASQIRGNLSSLPALAEKVVVKEQFLSEYQGERNFDCILYIDVIEHIEQDAAELREAYNSLRPGGHLIILVPAHQFLFSPFDQSIGHFRRYNISMLKKALPERLTSIQMKYLDAFGFFLSLGNKLFLKQSYPTKKQILFWDRYIVPVSRLIDPILLYKAGKSVLFVGKKQ